MSQMNLNQNTQVSAIKFWPNLFHKVRFFWLERFGKIFGTNLDQGRWSDVAAVILLDIILREMKLQNIFYVKWNWKIYFQWGFFTWNEIGKYIFNEVFWMTNSSIRLDDIWQKIRGKGWCSLYFRDLFLLFIYNFRKLAKIVILC